MYPLGGSGSLLLGPFLMPKENAKYRYGNI